MKILLPLWAESRDAVRSSIRSPPQNIVHSGSVVARTPHEKEAGWRRRRCHQECCRGGEGASFNITKANFLSLPKRSATVAAVGKRWEGRTRWKADGMGDGTNRWEISLSCCFSWTDGRTGRRRRRRTRIEKCCAQICFHSRGRVSSGEGWNRFQMERVRIWEESCLLEIR